MEFFSVENLISFLPVAALIIISPGPDSLLILDRSIRYGSSGGVLVALGVAIGHFVQNILCVLGLATLVYQSAIGFTIFKFLSAFVLIFLGVKALYSTWGLRKALKKSLERPEQNMSQNGFLLQGFVSNFFNPKSALFFMAFIPQFSVPADTSLPLYLKFFLVGLIFSMLATLWNSGLALFAGRVRRFLEAGSLIRKWIDTLSGAVLVLLGLRVAMQERPN